MVGCTYRACRRSGRRLQTRRAATSSSRREAFQIAGGFQNGMAVPRGSGHGLRKYQILHQGQPAVPGSGLPLRSPRDDLAPGDPEWCRFSYFRSRCYAEGLSKALVTASVGVADGLATERRYTTRVLPLGVAHGVADAVPDGTRRAWAGLERSWPASRRRRRVTRAGWIQRRMSKPPDQRGGRAPARRARRGGPARPRAPPQTACLDRPPCHFSCTTRSRLRRRPAALAVPPEAFAEQVAYLCDRRLPNSDGGSGLAEVMAWRASRLPERPHRPHLRRRVRGFPPPGHARAGPRRLHRHGLRHHRAGSRTPGRTRHRGGLGGC